MHGTRFTATAWICAGFLLVLAGGAGGQQSYPDRVGDAGGGADIRSVTVGNDATGTVTLRVTTDAPLAPTHGFVFYIDTDKLATTGSAARGVEAVLLVQPGRNFVSFLRWNGSSLAAASAPTLRFLLGRNFIQFSINRSDLRNTSGFRYQVWSIDPDLNVFDYAPEKGLSRYDFWACSNKRDDDRDGRVDFPRDRGCSGVEDDDEVGR
jgi:hypothetical protein